MSLEKLQGEDHGRISRIIWKQVLARMNCKQENVHILDLDVL